LENYRRIESSWAAVKVLQGIQFRWVCFGELKVGVAAHPFQKPFGTAFVEEKGAIRHSFDPGDDILRDVAKLGDFLSGEHIIRGIQSDLMKRFLVMRHKNVPFSQVKNQIKPDTRV